MLDRGKRDDVLSGEAIEQTQMTTEDLPTDDPLMHRRIVLLVIKLAGQPYESSPPPERDRFTKLGHGPDRRRRTLFENGS